LISLTEFLGASALASTGSIAAHPFRQLIFQIGIANLRAPVNDDPRKRSL
jgi:hypothetical protein